MAHRQEVNMNDEELVGKVADAICDNFGWIRGIESVKRAAAEVVRIVREHDAKERSDGT